MLIGCAAQGQGIKVVCADDALAAAIITDYRRLTPVYIAVSEDGNHAQAFTIRNGKKVWLGISPRYTIVVDEYPGFDAWGGKTGKVYQINEFLKLYGIKHLEILRR